MSFNKLERRAFRQISINEGVVSTIAKFFLGTKFRDAMREMERMKKDDPELKADLASFYQNYKILRNQLNTICKENPNLPNCK